MPLTSVELASPAATVIGASGVSRESPVDAACKLHDIDYENASRERDRVRAAQLILQADRRLFTRVSTLVNRQASAHNDLNLGEVLYAKGVRIAFGAKIVADGIDLVDRLRVRAFDRAESGARSALRTAAPYVVILAYPPAAAPMLVRARLPPRR